MYNDLKPEGPQLCELAAHLAAGKLSANFMGFVYGSLSTSFCRWLGFPRSTKFSSFVLRSTLYVLQISPRSEL